MKKIVLQFLFALLVILSTNKTQAQCTDNTAATSYVSNNSNKGTMFNIGTGSNSVIINSFDFNLILGSSGAYEIYYKEGSFVGSENNAAAWTLIGSSTNTPCVGFDFPSPMLIPLNITIPANAIYGFYVTATNVAATTGIRYTNNGGYTTLVDDGNVYITSGTGKAYPFSTNYANRSVNCTVHYSLGTVSEASVITTATATSSANNQRSDSISLYAASCTQLVCKVEGSGASPISGNTIAKVWIDNTQPASYVKRHYQIYPTSNASTATGKATLYFTQQELTDYNTQTTAPASLLPTSTSDANGKANLRIEYREGASNDNTGSPSSYTGTTTIINPTDADIVWNATASRWEVTFNTTGFGGFFLTSVASTIWNGTTWSQGTPNATIDATIASNTQPASFTSKSLIINNSFALNTASRTITVNGDITNNGNGFTGTGNIVMASSGALLGNAISFNGTLTINAATVLTTNNKLTLTSNSTATARVVGYTSSGYISGNVNVECYIAGGRRAYRFLGNPFSSSITLNELIDDIDITGSGGASNGFTTSTNNASSAYYYDATLGNGSTVSDPGWRPYTTTATSIGSGDGFRLFVRGSKGQANIFASPYATPNPVTITVTGSVNPGGDYVKNLVKGTNSGYNLISNPYISPVNLKSVTKTASVNNNYYIWNARLGTSGGYLTYTFGTNNYALPSLGAFFVNTTTTAQSITFKESDKVSTDTSTMLRQSPIKGLLEMSVHADGNMYDRFTMYMNDKAKAGYDELLDAAKFRNAEANFYSLSKDGKALAVDVRPFDGTAIPLGFTSNVAKSYTINVDNMNLDAGSELYLKDNYTGAYMLLQSGASYDFAVDASPASQGDQRFELVAKTSKPISLAIIGRVEVYPNPTTDVVTIKYNGLNEKENTIVNIVDVNGKVVRTMNVGKQSSINQNINTKAFANGVYVIEVVNGKEKQSQSIIKQ